VAVNKDQMVIGQTLTAVRNGIVCKSLYSKRASHKKKKTLHISIQQKRFNHYVYTGKR
jgi:hypothetical protein